jgi:hypothetical protein
MIFITFIFYHRAVVKQHPFLAVQTPFCDTAVAIIPPLRGSTTNTATYAQHPSKFMLLLRKVTPLMIHIIFV